MARQSEECRVGKGVDVGIRRIVYKNSRLAVDPSHFLRLMAPPPVIHPKRPRQLRQQTFSSRIQGPSRLSHPANIEHPAKLLAQKQRRFDSVRDKVRPWVTSRPEFSVVSRVKDEDQIEQHGPGDSFSSVS